MKYVLMPPIRVCIDATPLLVGHESGVSKFCRSLLPALADNATYRPVGLRHHLAKARAGADRGSAGNSCCAAGPCQPDRCAGRGCGSGGPRPNGSWVLPTWSTGPISWSLQPPRQRRVVTVHDLTPVKYPELCDPASLVFRDFVQRAVQLGAWVHTHSQYVADEIVDVFGADPSRVRAIWSGIPDLGAGTRFASGSRVDLPAGVRRYVLAIGTVEPRKGFPGLVRAFDRIAAAHPDVALVIIGSDGLGLHRAG